MIRPGKTVISEMLGASNKTAGWVKFLRCEDTNLFQLDKTLPLGGELWKEIPSRGFEALLQFCTTQRLAGILLSQTNSVRISIVFVKKQLQKPFRDSGILFCCLDWMTSPPLPPQVSQLFPAIFG